MQIDKDTQALINERINNNAQLLRALLHRNLEL